MSKFRFYYIDSSYISFLHKKDYRVQFNKTGRPYIGVVLQVGTFNYFVPLESPKPNHVNIHGGPVLKLDGGKLGIMGFNNMIPVPKSALVDFDIAAVSDSKYKALLYNQLSFCNKNSDAIHSKAQSVYEKACRGIPIYKKICCNFKKLEGACILYRA